jgi:hypothetical protein
MFNWIISMSGHNHHSQALRDLCCIPQHLFLEIGNDSIQPSLVKSCMMLEKSKLPLPCAW